MRFLSRDLSNQFISLSYQDVLQNYSQGGVNYVLDGLGYALFTVDSGSSVQNLSTASYVYLSQSVIDSNINNSIPAHQEGRLFWDKNNHTYAIYNDISDVTLQLGQEQLLRFQAGEDISNGNPVYISGSIEHDDGTHPIVYKAIADGSRQKYSVACVATHDVLSGSDGYGTVLGIVNDVNTIGLSSGKSVFLSHTVAGAITQSLPPDPHEKILIGYCIKEGITDGKILVNIVGIPDADRSFVGVTEPPSIVDNGDGTVTVGISSVSLCTTSDGLGVVRNYTLQSASFSIPNDPTDVVFVAAVYNNGNPIYQLVNDLTDIDSIQSTVVCALTRAIDGTVSYISNDAPGTLLANKLFNKSIGIYGFIQRSSGLILAESGSRYVTISSGVMWTGINKYQAPEFKSDVNSLYLLHHSGSSWSSSLITQFVNTQYDNGTGLSDLNPNKFVVNYVYKSATNQNRAMIMLTGEYNKLIDAQASQPPEVPGDLLQGGLLVGRAIYERSGSNAIQIDSAFSTQFTPSAVNNHNDLSNIQGGTTGEYYHLTSTDYTGNGTGTIVRSDGATLTGLIATGSLNGTASVSLTSSHGEMLQNSYTIDSGSTNLLFISSSGNIGIGTTSPSASLHIINAVEPLRLSYDTSKHTIFTVNSSGHLIIRPGPGQGRTLIGQHTADNGYGILNLSSTTPTATNYNFRSGADPSDLFINTRNTGKLQFQIEGVTKMTVSSSNIGIGTTSPSASLHIITPGSNSSSALIISQSMPISQSIPIIDIMNIWSGSSAQPFTGIRYNVIDSGSNSTASFIDFLTNGVSKNRIDKNGNIYISNNSATVLSTGTNLSVGATSQLFFTLGGSNYYTVLTSGIMPGANNLTLGDSTRNWQSIWLGGGSTGTLASGSVVLTSDATSSLALRRTGTFSSPQSQSFRIYNYYSASGADFERTNNYWSGSQYYISTEYSGSGLPRNIIFLTSGSNRLFISSSGNIGIGTTTTPELLTVNGKTLIGSTTQTPGQAILQISDQSGNTAGIDVRGNRGVTGVNSSFIRFYNTSTLLGQIVANIESNNLGSLTFNVASASVYNSALHISSSGRVGIGTTTPVGTLHVNGLIYGASGFASLNGGGGGRFGYNDGTNWGSYWLCTNGSYLATPNSVTIGSSNSTVNRLDVYGNISCSVITSSLINTNGIVARCNIKTDNYSLTTNDYLIIMSGSTSISASLPNATTNTGRVYRIKNVSPFPLYVTGSQNIDNVVYKILNQWDNIELASDGNRWNIM
jgi:hypothetical protein